MASKSWPITRTFRRQVSTRLGHLTDSVIYTVKDYRPDGNTRTSKIHSEKSLERPSKRSRTSSSPSPGCSQSFSWTSTSGIMASRASVYTGPHDSTGKTSSLPAPCCEDVSGEIQKSNKRKSTSDERTSSSSEGPTLTNDETSTEERISSKRKSTEIDTPRKRSRKTSTRRPFSDSSSAEDAGISTTDTPNLNSEAEGSDSRKRKSEETDRPRKRSKKTSNPRPFRESSSSEDAGISTSNIPSLSREAEGSNSRKRKSEEAPRKRSKKTCRPSEEPDTTTQSSTTDNLATSPLKNNNTRAAFEAKYTKRGILGTGGYGSVYAGYRREDYLPVAIKRIPQFDIARTSMLLDGKIRSVPMEVALLLKLKPAAGGTSSVVTLLDWYDLDNELILVLERPVPCLDMIDYLKSKGGHLQEDDTKILAKQIVDALIEVHSRGVFHRDIKLDNILLETGSDVPRVRLIDFGCGTFMSERIHTSPQGTYEYMSPEWFICGWYKADPTTVWQLGVVLFMTLHGHFPFKNSTEIVNGQPAISSRLSLECQDFIQSCLAKSPWERPTLKTLKNHPWLV